MKRLIITLLALPLLCTSCWWLSRDEVVDYYPKSEFDHDYKEKGSIGISMLPSCLKELADIVGQLFLQIDQPFGDILGNFTCHIVSLC